MAGIKVKDVQPLTDAELIADEAAGETSLARNDFVPGLESLIERAGPVDLKISIPLQEQKTEPADPPSARPRVFTLVILAILGAGLAYLLLVRRAPAKAEADEDCVDCDKAPKETYSIEQLLGMD